MRLNKGLDHFHVSAKQENDWALFWRAFPEEIMPARRKTRVLPGYFYNTKKGRTSRPFLNSAR
jgi:hypothetical protein